MARLRRWPENEEYKADAESEHRPDCSMDDLRVPGCFERQVHLKMGFGWVWCGLVISIVLRQRRLLILY